MLTTLLPALMAAAPAAANPQAAAVAEPFRPRLSSFFERLDLLFHPEAMLETLNHLPFLGASMVVVVGALCAFNGYRWHRWLIAALAFFCGLGIGYELTLHGGSRSSIIAAAVGCLLAIISTPLLRLTVAIFGGMAGAFIGANAWTATGVNPSDAHWAGAAIGFVLLAMTSLVLFRLVIVLFTSVGGSVMVVFGVITLLMHVPEWQEAVRASIVENRQVVPVLLTLFAVSAFVIQENRLRAGGVSIFALDGRGGGGDDE